MIAVFASGVGLFLSSLAVYFADVLDMYQIILTAWLYMTPVIYPPEVIPEHYRWLLRLNPLYYLLGVFRECVYGVWVAEAKSLAVASISAFLALVVGWWFFTLRADEFPYRV